MKKVLFVLLAVLLLSSCTKNIDFILVRDDNRYMWYELKNGKQTIYDYREDIDNGTFSIRIVDPNTMNDIEERRIYKNEKVSEITTKNGEIKSLKIKGVVYRFNSQRKMND